MGLHKPSVIPTLADVNADDEVTQVLASVSAFGSKHIRSETLHILSQSEPFYPVIPVHDRYLLLAVNSEKFKGVIWLSSWFEVVSAYRDSKNIHRVRLRINGKIIEVDYDILYPKDIIKLSKHGLIVNFDHADDLSKFIFKQLANCTVAEKPNGMGFFMQDSNLTFRAYDEDPQILDYTKGITQAEYITKLNQLITNSALMFALCCSCAALFLAFLSMVCGLQLMRNMIGDTVDFRLTERVINEYSVILLAGKVLQAFGVNIDLDAVTAILIDNSRTLRTETNVAEQYYRHLLAFVALHPYHTGIKKDESCNSVAFIDEVFLEILAGYGATNSDLVIDELNKAGYLVRRKANSLKNRRRFNGTLVSCYEIKLPEDNTSADDNSMTLKYILTHYEGLDES